jgi:hypothetical protein
VRERVPLPFLFLSRGEWPGEREKLGRINNSTLVHPSIHPSIHPAAPCVFVYVCGRIFFGVCFFFFFFSGEGCHVH